MKAKDFKANFTVGKNGRAKANSRELRIDDATPKPKRVKHEHSFEKELEFVASLSGFSYIKIPDWIATRERIETLQRTGRSNEKQKPFDGILVTPKAIYCVECKYGKNKLSYHQSRWQEVVNSIKPDGFLVIRKLDDKYETCQLQIGDKVCDFTDIQALLNSLK